MTKLTSRRSSRSLLGTESFGKKADQTPARPGPRVLLGPRSDQVGVPPRCGVPPAPSFPQIRVPSPCGFRPGPGSPQIRVHPGSGFRPHRGSSPVRVPPRSASPQAQVPPGCARLAPGTRARDQPETSDSVVGPRSGPFRSLGSRGTSASGGEEPRGPRCRRRRVPAGSAESWAPPSVSSGHVFAAPHAARRSLRVSGIRAGSRDGRSGFPPPLRVPRRSFVCRVNCCPLELERQWQKRGGREEAEQATWAEGRRGRSRWPLAKLRWLRDCCGWPGSSCS